MDDVCVPIGELDVGKDYLLNTLLWEHDPHPYPSPTWHGAIVRVLEVRECEVDVQVVDPNGATVAKRVTTILMHDEYTSHGLVEMGSATPEEIEHAISNLRAIVDDLSLESLS